MGKSVLLWYKGGETMEIKALSREEYKGKRFTARYTTTGYIDIVPTPDGFRMERKAFPLPVERSFDDEFFSDWLDAPTAYGAFEDGLLIGYSEGAPEEWNNRFRISNICVFDASRRGSGIGSALMEAICAEAVKTGARMIVLETQTCNENAIAFYRRHGFEIIGFDLYSYSNDDPARHEVRIEMGKKIPCFPS